MTKYLARTLTILVLLGLVGLAQTAHADSPARIPVQGVLHDISGNPIDEPLEVIFTLYADSAGENELWTSVQTVDFAQGFFSIYWGETTPLELEFFRDNSQIFLGISIVANNIASLNGSVASTIGIPEPQNNGLRTFANSIVINNQFHENDGAGIRVSSTDTYVSGNIVTDNDRTGIEATGSGGLFLGNRAAGNVLNYNFGSGNAFGNIVDITAAGDISGTANADHAHANFIY